MVSSVPARRTLVVPMKKSIRRAVVALVTVLLLAVGFLVGRSVWKQRQQDVAQAGLEFIPGVSQHIRDFHRVKEQDGRKVWEVNAEDARYVDDDKAIIVHDANMLLYTKDGRTVGLKADEGRIQLDGRDITQVDLSGAIEVSMAEYTMHTDRATYEHARQRISAPGVVEIAGQAMHLRGDRMEVDVETQRLRLRDHVATRLQPNRLKEGGRDAPL